MRPRGPLWRIGEGWDTHALVEGRKLILGGVEIVHTHGLLGHSDADALCHAITDALFGAAALGDIGHHFPESDAQYQGADSLALLSEAARRVRKPSAEPLRPSWAWLLTAAYPCGKARRRQRPSAAFSNF